jgi:hypothetical protein
LPKPIACSITMNPSMPVIERLSLAVRLLRNWENVGASEGRSEALDEAVWSVGVGPGDAEFVPLRRRVRETRDGTVGSLTDCLGLDMS